MIKRKSILNRQILTGLFLAAALTNVMAQNSEITISDIRSTKGQIVIAVFKNEKAFKETKPFKTFPYVKKGMINGKLVVECELEPGTYGITLLDDENKNGEMEKNFVGIPKEGFGFSNFYLEKLKAPSFSDFKTDIKSEDNKIRIKVKYM